MLIKKISWGNHPERLINYINKEGVSDENLTFYHNILIPDEKHVIEDFKNNAEFIKPAKNRVYFYHEILSFSPEDTEHLNAEIINDLVAKYLSLRAPENIAYGKVHTDKKHVHVHIILSSNSYCSPKLWRADNKQFASLREELEQYQQEKYPGLSSLVYLNAKEKKKDRIKQREQSQRKEREYKLRVRLKGQPTQKDIISQAVKECYERADNIAEFYDYIMQTEEVELSLYTYRGKTSGVINETGKKFRFKTLGISKKMLKALETQEKAFIQKLKKIQAQQRGLSQEKEI